MRKFIKFIVLGCMLSLILAACNLPGNNSPDAAATLQAVYTVQAGTVAALQTQAVSRGTPVSQPTISFPTMPPSTPMPSLTPIKPPGQPAATQKPVTSYCDWAGYIKDVTVEDGTVFTPGEKFTKTWRLENIGTCAWTGSYKLIFSNGNSMDGAATTSIPSPVNPGQHVDISVNLTAPFAEGDYHGDWLLRNGAGVSFGLGNTAREPFFVNIKVVGGMTTVLDFAKDYCTADWRSDAGDLGCPGNTSGKKGYVSRLDNPKLENGQTFSGQGLLTVPQFVNNGMLQGFYQPFTVQKGDRFRAIINCAYLANGCNAIFRLDYQINKDPVKTIWHFTEAYEGLYYTVDTDLSALAGKQVVFILTVLSNGAADLDRPVWAGPRIDRPSNLVTPSPTPTVTSTVTITPTVTMTPTITASPTVTATPTVTMTATLTPTATPTLP